MKHNGKSGPGDSWRIHWRMNSIWISDFTALLPFIAQVQKTLEGQCPVGPQNCRRFVQNCFRIRHPELTKGCGRALIRTCSQPCEMWQDLRQQTRFSATWSIWANNGKHFWGFAPEPGGRRKATNTLESVWIYSWFGKNMWEWEDTGKSF